MYYTIPDKRRLSDINRMILEMANGNFSYKIERSEYDDDLERIGVVLNMFAQEMREKFRHHIFINPHETYKHIIQMTFVLDKDLRVRSLNAAASEILLFEISELQGIAFTDLLIQGSRSAWEKEVLCLRENEDHTNTISLSFKTNNTLVVPALCSISNLHDSSGDEKIMVTSLQTVSQSHQNRNEILQEIKSYKRRENLKKNAGKVAGLRRTSDINKIREIYEHILQNLDEPLLSLKELAQQFGTNEYKIKQGFRQFYDTTVFRLQTDERLKKAQYLIRNRDLPLKTVAALSGFKSFSHFSITFKKKYGYNASTLQKVIQIKNLRQFSKKTR